MSSAGVLGSLLQDVLFGLAASHEITVSYHVITVHYLGHKNPPLAGTDKMLPQRIQLGGLSGGIEKDAKSQTLMWGQAPH
jgi:hypothetical protein